MDINKYIDDYLKWLRSEITFSKLGEYYEITSPFLDLYNDYVQIYVKQENGKIFFSDDGFTIKTLESHGFNMSPSRKKQMESILIQFGVTLKSGELTLIAKEGDFPQKKHQFIQAILRISDMYMITRSKTASYFLDDLAGYFDKNEIYYSDNIQIRGKTGFSHNYDFLINRSKTKPERLCTAINNPTRNSMDNALFTWHDTKITRKKDSELIVFLNDRNTIQPGVIEGFSNYDVKTILWSEREKKSSLEMLSA